MIIQTKKDHFRGMVNKASKWIKNWIMMLVATYIAFTVAVNFLGINQRGASLLVSVALFVIIIGVLGYVIWMNKRSVKLLSNDTNEKP